MFSNVRAYITDVAKNEKVLSDICPLESNHVELWKRHVQPKLFQNKIPGYDWDWEYLLNLVSEKYHCFCLIVDKKDNIPNGMIAVSADNKEHILESEKARNILQVEFLASSYESFDCVESPIKYKHVGSALLDRVLLLSSELDHAVTGKFALDAIPTAVGFYKKYGMIRTGEIRGNYEACYDHMELQEIVGKNKLDQLYS